MKIYICKVCTYCTSEKCNYERHKESPKHRGNVNFFLTDEYKEYTQIEEGYYINRQGDIFSSIKGKKLKSMIDKNGYVVFGSPIGKDRYLHRLLVKSFVPNPDDKPHVDHIDGDPLNNSIDNLRWCTQKENVRNSKSHSGSSSKYKGVSWDKSKNKWEVNMYIENKKKFIGRFDEEEEAARAYDAYAKIHHGEFAKLNFD